MSSLLQMRIWSIDRTPLPSLVNRTPRYLNTCTYRTQTARMTHFGHLMLGARYINNTYKLKPSKGFSWDKTGIYSKEWEVWISPPYEFFRLLTVLLLQDVSIFYWKLKPVCWCCHVFMYVWNQRLWGFKFFLLTSTQSWCYMTFLLDTTYPNKAKPY